MKHAFFALLFAAVAGVSQAVTYTWTSATGDAFTGFKDTSGNTVTFSGDFSITLSFTASGISTSAPATFIQLLTANGANNAGELRVNNVTGSNLIHLGTYKSSGSAAWNKSQGDFSVARLTNENGKGSGTNTIVINFTGWNAETQTYNRPTYSITFANGDTSNNRDFSASGTGDTTPGFGMDDITWTSVATGAGITLTGMTLEATPVDIPEPTVLALLALGVAGLALRRRA